SGARPAVPAKITSSIFPPRSAFAPCSPSTHAMASTTLDLPEPLGPTTHVMPGSSLNVVADAKDLKPLTVRLLRCTALRGVVRARQRADGRWPKRDAGGVSLSQATAARPVRPATTDPFGHKDARRLSVGARCVLRLSGTYWTCGHTQASAGSAIR